MNDDPGPTSDPVRHFDNAVDLYVGKHYGETVRSFMTERMRRMLELIDGLSLPGGASVLDAGCGPGHLVEQLALRGFAVYGLDGAEGMLRRAQGRLTEVELPYRATFQRADIEALPYQGASFDLVCSAGVIEYLAGDDIVLAEFHRVLRPGGCLVLPVTNAWSPTLWLDGGVELIKRRRALRRPLDSLLRRVGRPPLLPRDFTVRRHRPGRLRDALEGTGFDLVGDVYFHFLPWPRPFDQLLPRLTSWLGRPMERLGRTPLGILAEGYLALAVKRGA